MAGCLGTALGEELFMVTSGSTRYDLFQSVLGAAFILTAFLAFDAGANRTKSRSGSVDQARSPLWSLNTDPCFSTFCSAAYMDSPVDDPADQSRSFAPGFPFLGGGPQGAAFFFFSPGFRLSAL